jgi:hypothetical protein
VEDTTINKLRIISKEEKRSIGQIVTDLVETYEKEKFWKEMREGFERLRADPIAWKEYQDEFALWETAAGDGLEIEPPYYTPEEEAEINAEYARTYGR